MRVGWRWVGKGFSCLMGWFSCVPAVDAIIGLVLSGGGGGWGGVALVLL